MRKRQYKAPILLTSPGPGDVTGDGSGQGTYVPYMTYEDWWADIAWEGTNLDADYNGDGKVDQDDYDYWIENELWNGEE